MTSTATQAVGARPDPERLGGLGWTRRTGGRLTGAERRRLLAHVGRTYAQVVAGRIRLATGRLPPGASDLDLDAFAPPDSAFVREAAAAASAQGPELLGHAERTWLFGNALAVLDRVPLEPEAFRVAALVHDLGLVAPQPGRCFTLAGAEAAVAAAARAGAPAAAGEAVADAVCAHATPGVSVAVDGPLGTYVQAGAMADVIGMRLWDVGPRQRAEVLRRHPRTGFPAALHAAWTAESRAVPDGRAAFATRYALILVAMRLAPLPG